MANNKANLSSKRLLIVEIGYKCLFVGLRYMSICAII